MVLFLRNIVTCRVTGGGSRAIQSPHAAEERFRPEEIHAAQPRVGTTPMERLDWAIRFARTDLGALSRGDWSNLRLELTAFAELLIKEHDAAKRSRREGLLKAEPERHAAGVYPELETRELHREFSRIIGRLLQSDSVKIGSYEVTLTLERLRYPTAGTARPVRLRTGFPPGPSRATHVLGHLLGIYGHLVKECPAPRPRGAAGERCGRWFVARRPNQVYCCARCQSRATTRAARQASPPAKPPRRASRRTRAG